MRDLGDRVTEGHVDEDLVLVVFMDDVLKGQGLSVC
jgi:hypothetical protein